MPVLETPVISLLLVALAAYLLGSVPFGLLVARAMKLGDPRKIGSGNIGATNVLRTGNKTAAAVTLLLDGGKGALAVVLSGLFFERDACQLAGFAAFAGHCFPIWLRFRGGKGVATFFGIWWVLAPPVAALISLTWLVSAATLRMASVAALVSAWLALVWLGLMERGDTLALAIAMAVIMTWCHRSNIARVLAGTEAKIGKSS